jgi:MFS transporter, PAT family, beta-lactamase induction signal transducer AmpG
MNPALQKIFSKPMLIALAMGFSSGLPLLLTGSTLQAWLKESGVSLTNIGLSAFIGLPYTLKFLWAPVFDRYVLPMGRRRGWLLLTQLLLVSAIVAVAFSHPKSQLAALALVSLLLTFFSASQDIVIDAYRRESLTNDELSFGSALAVNGYRVGMLVASGGALILADATSFQTAYLVMAAAMGVGILTTLLSPEPTAGGAPPKTLQEAVVAPFVEFFKRDGAIATLAFLLLYKLGDNMAGAITTPFYLELGFTKTEIGTVVKLWGFWPTIVGGTVGGLLVLKIGLPRALVWFGIGQILSTFGFVVLAKIGHSVPTLAAVVAFENLTAGMGMAAFVGLMGALTDRRFTATQYALLSSLMGVPRVIFAAPTGAMAEAMGWQTFFIFCCVVALPGMWLALRARSWLDATDASQK